MRGSAVPRPSVGHHSYTNNPNSYPQNRGGTSLPVPSAAPYDPYTSAHLGAPGAPQQPYGHPSLYGIPPPPPPGPQQTLGQAVGKEFGRENNSRTWLACTVVVGFVLPICLYIGASAYSDIVQAERFLILEANRPPAPPCPPSRPIAPPSPPMPPGHPPKPPYMPHMPHVPPPPPFREGMTGIRGPEVVQTMYETVNPSHLREGHNCPAVFTGSGCRQPIVLPECMGTAAFPDWLTVERASASNFSHARLLGMDSLEDVDLLPQFDFLGDHHGPVETCAVVSERSQLKDRGMGLLIDKNELVVRINNAPTMGHEHDVGSKTGIRITDEFYEGFREKDGDAVVSLGWCRVEPCSRADLVRVLAKKVHPINPQFVQKLQRALTFGHPHDPYTADTTGNLQPFPTTEYLTTVLLLHVCTRLTVYGFNIMEDDTAPQTSQVRTSKYYYDDGLWRQPYGTLKKKPVDMSNMMSTVAWRMPEWKYATGKRQTSSMTPATAGTPKQEAYGSAMPGVGSYTAAHGPDGFGGRRRRRLLKSAAKAKHDKHINRQLSPSHRPLPDDPKLLKQFLFMQRHADEPWVEPHSPERDCLKDMARAGLFVVME